VFTLKTPSRRYISRVGLRHANDVTRSNYEAPLVIARTCDKLRWDSCPHRGTQSLYVVYGAYHSVLSGDFRPTRSGRGGVIHVHSHAIQSITTAAYSVIVYELTRIYYQYSRVGQRHAHAATRSITKLRLCRLWLREHPSNCEYNGPHRGIEAQVTVAILDLLLAKSRPLQHGVMCNKADLYQSTLITGICENNNT